MKNFLVLHDYFEALEGGGKLSSILARELGGAIGYGFARSQHPFLHKLAHQHDLRAYSRLPLWKQWRLARAFQTRTAFVRDYATRVYSGFYAPLAVVQGASGRNLLYCHTPPRFVYDQRDFYLRTLPAFARPLLQHFIHYLQPRYEAAAQQMDLIVVNSANIRQRLQEYLGLDAQVVYPPCDLSAYRWQPPQGYYLSVGRHDPLKRIDLIIQAFLRMPQQRLVVASGGAQTPALKRLAGTAPNIHFTGWLSESALHALIGQAIAVIYLPQAEDFGMSPVEAMAAGKPVIGVADGGLLETIVPQQTGLLLSAQPCLDELIAAVKALDTQTAVAMRAACEARARLFSQENFLQQMYNLMFNKPLPTVILPSPAANAKPASGGTAAQ